MLSCHSSSSVAVQTRAGTDFDEAREMPQPHVFIMRHQNPTCFGRHEQDFRIWPADDSAMMGIQEIQLRARVCGARP